MAIARLLGAELDTPSGHANIPESRIFQKSGERKSLHGKSGRGAGFVSGRDTNMHPVSQAQKHNVAGPGTMLFLALRFGTYAILSLCTTKHPCSFIEPKASLSPHVSLAVIKLYSDKEAAVCAGQPSFHE